VLGFVVLAVVSLITWLDPGTTWVPLVEGEHVEQAVTELEKQGFRAEIIQEVHANVPAGIVITQKPTPGTIYRRNRDVFLVISSGQPQLTSPAPSEREPYQNQLSPTSHDQTSAGQQGQSGEDG
jgi:beta-lactam-binding protein with PASTA domain